MTEVPHYVYVYSQIGYDCKYKAKVGVSINPEKRRFKHSPGYRNYGCYTFHKKYLAPDRREAFALESAVKRHFKPLALCPELFQVHPDIVCAFIEAYMGELE